MMENLSDSTTSSEEFDKLVVQPAYQIDPQLHAGYFYSHRGDGLLYLRSDPAIKRINIRPIGCQRSPAGGNQPDAQPEQSRQAHSIVSLLR